MITATTQVRTPVVEPGECVEWCLSPRPWLETAEIHTKIFGARLPTQGLWWDEPDEARWTDPGTGYPCAMHRNRYGSWNGYVRVPEGHVLYGHAYHDGPENYLDPHGGITYSGPLSDYLHDMVEGNDWWLGFDTGHAWDLAPGRLAIIDPYDESEYRDLNYVKAEVTRLAAQIRLLAG